MTSARLEATWTLSLLIIYSLRTPESLCRQCSLLFCFLLTVKSLQTVAVAGLLSADGKVSADSARSLVCSLLTVKYLYRQFWFTGLFSTDGKVSTDSARLLVCSLPKAKSPQTHTRTRTHAPARLILKNNLSVSCFSSSPFSLCLCICLSLSLSLSLSLLSFNSFQPPNPSSCCVHPPSSLPPPSPLCKKLGCLLQLTRLDL